MSELSVLKNTIVLSLLKVLIGFPGPIIFALMLNEIANLRGKKIFQTVSYLVIIGRGGRKRRVYEESTGVRPARVILATASIHSRRVQALRQLGIEVIEPEETDGS